VKLPKMALLTGLAGFALLAQAADITTAMLDNAAKDTRNVLSFGMGSQGQRYSPLTQVNTNNVGRLVPAWSFSFGGEKQRGQESQPVIAGGRMFVTASYSRIFAIDLKTGNKLWKYEHRLPDGIMPCCDVVNRGAALYGNLVIFGTLDAQLVALDQATGKVVWKEKVDDYAAGYSMTAAPLIAKGVLMNGVSGGEFGVVGRVEGRNPMTGELLWSRPTVEGHMGYRYDKDGKAIETGVTGTVNKSWPGELWKTGGASTWMGGTYDPGTGLAYFGTGNPAPWNSHLRPGDNLYSSSTLALDPETGQIKWAYQGTPNDSWDFDGANEFVIPGRRRRTARARAHARAGPGRLAGRAGRAGAHPVLLSRHGDHAQRPGPGLCRRPGAGGAAPQRHPPCAGQYRRIRRFGPQRWAALDPGRARPAPRRCAGRHAGAGRTLRRHLGRLRVAVHA
jgi:alcohol dehydrogenase (cytochrome c)